MTDAINAAIAGALLVFAAWAIRRSTRAVIRADRAVEQILHGDTVDPDTTPGSNKGDLSICQAIDSGRHTAYRSPRKEDTP